MSPGFSGGGKHPAGEFGEFDKVLPIGGIFGRIGFSGESSFSGVVEFCTGFGGEHESSGNTHGTEAVELVGIIENFCFEGGWGVAGAVTVLTDGLGNLLCDLRRGVLQKEIAGNDGTGGGVVNFALRVKFLRAGYIVQKGCKVNDLPIGLGQLLSEGKGVFDDPAGVIKVVTVGKIALERGFYEILC